MADMYDAVDWTVLEALPGPFAGYRDGPVSAWPAEAWATLGARTPLAITVLADERWQVFDSETGNAGTDAVATAVANRFQDKQWSWCYTNQQNCSGLTQSLKRKSMVWADRSEWPKPGVYLWAASPGVPPGSSPPWCPVAPVAVQDRWEGTHDVSTLFVPLDWQPVPVPAPAPPAPAPAPAEVRVTVQLLQVQENNEGAPVRALQILLNGQEAAGLTVDGIFGPKTLTAVEAYQRGHGLTVDGIAGVHTWGDLLGVPQ